MTTAGRPPDSRAGHFLLESGLHADRWFDLDTLLRDPHALDASLDRLGALLKPFGFDALCGPSTGGAFVAFAMAARLRVCFFHTERGDDAPSGPFAARYRLRTGDRAAVRGRRVAIVDDLVSATSATRATHRALVEAGAAVVAVGALYACGTIGRDALRALGTPFVAVETLPLDLRTPDHCPACRAGMPLERPA